MSLFLKWTIVFFAGTQNWTHCSVSLQNCRLCVWILPRNYSWKKLFNILEDVLKMLYNWSVWNTFHWICLKIAFNWICWMHFLFRTIWLFFSTSTTLKLHVVKILRMIIIRINLKSLIKSTLKKNIPTTIMLMLRTPMKPAASSRASCSAFSFSTSPPWSAPSCSWSFPSGFDGIKLILCYVCQCYLCFHWNTIFCHYRES